MDSGTRMDTHRSSPPPPVRRNTARAAIVITCGAVIVLLMLVVILKIDTGSSQQAAATSPDDDVIELVAPPSQLTEQEEQRYAGAGEEINTQLETRLPQGGWIQMQDDRGRLGQRYRFRRQEPRPDGWYWLEQPEAQVFLSDNEAVMLTGQESVAYAPNQALEQGTISGDVVIRVFRLDDRRVIDPAADSPTFIVRTDEAMFDNVVGEVRCPGEVHLELPGKAELHGEKLTLRINDLVDRIEMLELSRVHYVKLVHPDNGPAAASAPGRSRRPAVRFASMQAAQDSGTSESDKPTQFYQLTLRDNVVIMQGPADARRVVRGDLLSITFSTETEGLEDAFAFAWPSFGGSGAAHRENDAAHPIPLHSLIAAQSIAATPQGSVGVAVPAPGPDETIITVDGPLRVLPVDDPQQQLERAEDARFEVTGTPVELIDDAERAVATASMLRYDALDRRVQLIASDDHPVVIDSPQLKAGGERFWLAQNDGNAGFDGRGWIVPQQDRDPAPPPDQTPPADDMADLLEEMRISWSRSVRLDFHPPGDGETLGPIRRVRFLGDVNIETADGNIQCNVLDLAVRQGADGKPAPERMQATGDVRASGEGRTLWADTLDVEFADDDRRAADTESDSDVGDIQRVVADGDVQILMPDGSRAFANRLEGDGINETLELFDDTILIAAGRMIIEQRKTLQIRREQLSAFGDGPGEARVYNRAINTGADRRIERPDIDHDDIPPVVRARWDQSLLYDHSFNDGAGSVDLRGNVVAESSRATPERNIMKGDGLTLEFAADPADGSAALQGESADDLGSIDDRRLARFIARGDASIESRTWKTESRAEKPRIFYAAGPYIEYNDLTFESRIIGAGSLLIRDEWIDVELPSPPRIVGPGQRADPGATFSGKGTTQFKFTRELHMTQLLENRYRIEMTGDVSVIHESLTGEIATLTGQQLAAVVSRATDDRPRETGLDLGGAMELKRIDGSGALLVKTPTRTVECDTFEYNVETNLARVAAARGRSITVLTEGTPYPLHAGEVLWNMANDSITIISGAGAASP